MPLPKNTQKILSCVKLDLNPKNYLLGLKKRFSPVDPPAGCSPWRGGCTWTCCWRSCSPPATANPPSPPSPLPLVRKQTSRQMFTGTADSLDFSLPAIAAADFHLKHENHCDFQRRDNSWKIWNNQIFSFCQVTFLPSFLIMFEAISQKKNPFTLFFITDYFTERFTVSIFHITAEILFALSNR